MKYIIHSLLFICIVLVSFASCKHETKTDTSTIPKAWNFVKNIPLDSFGIISIAQADGSNFWLSDADNNQLVLIDKEGKVIETKTGDFDRPMHLSKNANAVLIANYGSDNLLSFQNGKAEKISFSEKFDAPSGIDQSGDKIAVADFYNHRIVYKQGDKTSSFGKKGDAAGEFTYPTDVQFANEKIYVADAYNHRIQVFDLAGKHLQTIGEAEKMNATTGVFVNEKNIFATDFENNRILIYDLDGKLMQEIKEHLDKPTDVLVVDNQLFVANYHGRYLSIFDYSAAITGYFVCPMNCFPPDKNAGKCPKCGMDKKAIQN